MFQALAAALQLLADVEAQIRTALGLAASASIYDAPPEQLQSLPPAVLATLEVRAEFALKRVVTWCLHALTSLSGVLWCLPVVLDGTSAQLCSLTYTFFVPPCACICSQSTLEVVEELRQRQQASPLHPPEALEATETLDSAAATTASGVMHGQVGMGHHASQARALSSGSNAAAQHVRVGSPASNQQRSPTSGSNKRLGMQQQSSATHLHVSKGSTGSPQAASRAAAAAAARSSLFTPDASRQARAEWLAGKLQQQQIAACVLERDLQREQQLLQKLADKKVAAEAAHTQVGRPYARACRHR
jgi:hypothetical protein